MCMPSGSTSARKTVKHDVLLALSSPVFVVGHRCEAVNTGEAGSSRAGLGGADDEPDEGNDEFDDE